MSDDAEGSDDGAEHVNPAPPGPMLDPHRRLSSVTRAGEASLPTRHGTFHVVAYHEANGGEHLALIKGNIGSRNGPVAVRLHSECMTGDVFGSLRCDCGPQLEAALEMIEHEGTGVVLYLDQEGRGIGLLNKLRADPKRPRVKTSSQDARPSDAEGLPSNAGSATQPRRPASPRTTASSVPEYAPISRASRPFRDAIRWRPICAGLPAPRARDEPHAGVGLRHFDDVA